MSRTVLAVIVALLGVAPGGASGADSWGIVVDRQGRIFLADGQNLGGRVWRIDPDGRQEPVVTGKRTTSDLFLQRDGSCYGLQIDREWKGGSLWKVGEDKVLTTFDVPPPLENRLIWGNFVLDERGHVYFYYDHRVWHVDPKGLVHHVAGDHWGDADGEGKNARFMSTQAGLAWGPDQALYIADFRKMRRVTRDGHVNTVAKGLMDRFPGDQAPRLQESNLGLTISRDGTMYVANPLYRRILKVTPDGKLSVLNRSEENWWPMGVTLHGDSLYVSEFDLRWSSPKLRSPRGPRVRRIDASGKSTVVATIGG